jgi:competence protein ComEC
MTPLLAFVLCLAAGLLVGLRSAEATTAVGRPLVIFLACCGLWLVTWTAVAIRGRRASGRTALAGAALLGSALGSAGGHDAAGHCLARLADGERVTLRGTLASLPWPDAATDLAVRSIRSPAGWVRCHGEVRVRLPGRARAPVPGQPVQLAGRWFAYPPDSRWPQPPGRTGSLSAASIRPDSGRSAPLLTARGAVQARIRTLLPTEAAGTAEALLLARREGLDPELKADFAAAGLTHLLAISGTHVGLVAGVLLLLFGAMRLPANRAAGAAAVVAVAYVLFLGAPHAAARAALQLLALLVVRLLQRPSDRLTLLAAAGFVLVLADPLAPLDAGFQLSFAGIFGLIAWRRGVLDRLPARLPGFVRDGIAAGTAATLATAPIAALHFGTFAPVAIAANLVAVPLVAAAVPALGLVLALDPVSNAAAAFLGTGASAILAALRATAACAAAIPGGHFLVSSGGVFSVLAAVAAGVLATRALRIHGGRVGASGQRMRSARIAAVGAGLAVVLAWPALGRHTGDGAIEIHAIDVGQGDAIAVRTPRGRWILVDAGDRTDQYDAGRSRVVPFLLQHGVREIAVLVLTHPHADHIGGAAAVFEAFDVRAVTDPAIASANGVYLTTIQAARAEGARWLAAREGRVLSIDDVVLEFLAPSEAMVDDPGDPNDYSVVFRLGFGRFAALFTGDAPRAVEDRVIMSSGSGLRFDVLKVGHHGSDTSTGDSLLSAAGPRVALVSVGQRNRYGHPDPDVLARLARHGVRVLRTDEVGAVTVRAGRDGSLELRTAR